MMFPLRKREVTRDTPPFLSRGKEKKYQNSAIGVCVNVSRVPWHSTVVFPLKTFLDFLGTQGPVLNHVLPQLSLNFYYYYFEKHKKIANLH